MHKKVVPQSNANKIDKTCIMLNRSIRFCCYVCLSFCPLWSYLNVCLSVCLYACRSVCFLYCYVWYVWNSFFYRYFTGLACKLSKVGSQNILLCKKNYNRDICIHFSNTFPLKFFRYSFLLRFLYCHISLKTFYVLFIQILII